MKVIMKGGTVNQSERKKSKGGELSEILPLHRGGSGAMQP